jgi:two-component system response regulator FixJ
MFSPQSKKSRGLTMDQNLIPWSESYHDVKPTNEIFVVDDDENMREMLAITLKAEGFPVKTFEDGDAFLKAAATRVPICVFLDVVMPRRSGLEILRELRERRYWTPVYLTSARDDLPTVVEAMQSGAHDYIKKPFDPYGLVPRVHNAVEMWSRRERTMDPLDFRANGIREWFRVTPSERDMLMLMRLMDT